MCGRCHISYVGYFIPFSQGSHGVLASPFYRWKKMKVRDYSVLPSTNSNLNWIQPKIRSLNTSPWSLFKKNIIWTWAIKKNKQNKKPDYQTTAFSHKSHQVNQGSPRLLSCNKIRVPTWYLPSSLLSLK